MSASTKQLFITITDSNGNQRSGETLFQEWIANMKRPHTHTLTLDTTQPIDSCLEKTMAYLKEIQNS